MKSPFKFLDSYTKDDREIFFGREREIEELYHRVFESKILLVYGVSGTGKSSLIHCGLANKFSETDWLPLVVRRGGSMIESLTSVINSASLTAQQSKFLTHYKPAFFIFDQFEELFIFGDKEERLLFIHIVKTLTESELQCRMIFVMHEEYMAGVTEFEKFIPTFFSKTGNVSDLPGSFVVTASCDKKCYIWNINKDNNRFNVYDSLTGHNDTVWSCEFNRTGKYKITASADSTIRIWDLNGRERNAEFSFGYNYLDGRRYKVKYGEYDDDVENPDLSPYYRKVCNATFSKDELSVVATGYF